MKKSAVASCVAKAGNCLDQKPTVYSGRNEALALETAKLLLESGAEINATSPEGETALDAANKMGYKPVIEFLVSNGAKAGTAANKNKTIGRDKGALAEEPTEPK